MAGINNAPFLGVVSQTIYTMIFYGAPTIYGNWVFWEEGTKGKINLPDLSNTNVLQARSCDFTPFGDFTLDNIEIEPCPLDINVQFCREDFYKAYDQAGIWAQRAGAANNTIPPALMNAIVMSTIEKASEELEVIMWRGDTAGGTGEELLCDGWLVGFLADGTVVDVPGVVLDETNIREELTKLYLAASPKVIDRHQMRGDARIWVDPTALMFLNVAVTDGYVNFPGLIPRVGANGETQLYFNTIPIVSTYGMRPNEMVLSFNNNLIAATDLKNDFQTLETIDTKPFSGNKYILLDGQMDIGVTHWKGEYVTYYHP